VARKRRRCCWRGGEEQRSFSSINGKLPGNQRKRETHLPITRRVVRRVHSECAKLPRRAQFSVAAAPTMMTGFNGWMDDFILCFLRLSFYTSLSEKIIVRPRNSTTNDGRTDGRIDGWLMLLGGPSSGFVVPGGHRSSWSTSRQRLKINWKSILWCSHSGNDPHEDLLKFGYKPNLKLIFLKLLSIVLVNILEQCYRNLAIFLKSWSNSGYSKSKKVDDSSTFKF
jgi:hypothetical protein